MVFFSSWEGEKISLVDATSRVARQPSKPPSDIAFGLQMALHQRWMDGTKRHGVRREAASGDCNVTLLDRSGSRIFRGFC